MGRESFSPKEFGVKMTKPEFTDKMVEMFGAVYRGCWSIEELTLHPREALAFCDTVRREMVAFDLPDDIILRVIVAQRKKRKNGLPRG